MKTEIENGYIEARMSSNPLTRFKCETFEVLPLRIKYFDLNTFSKGDIIAFYSNFDWHLGEVIGLIEELNSLRIHLFESFK